MRPLTHVPRVAHHVDFLTKIFRITFPSAPFELSSLTRLSIPPACARTRLIFPHQIQRVLLQEHSLFPPSAGIDRVNKRIVDGILR